jgi:transposase-like protein
VDSRLGRKRDIEAAKAFFRKALKTRGRTPLSITLDGYVASHRAVREMPVQGTIWKDTNLRPSEYFNDMIEQNTSECEVAHCSRARLQNLQT